MHRMAQDQYDCEFNICANQSLQILVRDRKSRRKFMNLFTKAKLKDMNLEHSVDELVILLQTARDAQINNLKNWKFLIKYKSNSYIINTHTLNAKNTLFSYKNGDKMIILLNINESTYKLSCAFKLNEIITNQISSPHSLSQSTTNNPFSFTSNVEQQVSQFELKVPKSPRRVFEIKKSKRKRIRKRSKSDTPKIYQKNKNKKSQHKTNRNLTNSFSETKEHKNDLCYEKHLKIAQLLNKIQLLEKENNILSNKMKQNKPKPLQLKRKQNSNNEKDKKENKLWLKHKIERLQKSLNTKILKEFGINFKQNNNWRDTINVSFNIIKKLAKSVNSKEEQYESVSSKWILLKKENKELKKTDSVKNAMTEKHKNMINDLKQQITEKNKKINILKQNQRNLEDKIKKMEHKFAQKSNEYDTEIEGINRNNISLNVQLNNSLQEMTETKADFDEIQKENKNLCEINSKLINDVEKLKYYVNDTNQKTLQLIQCINNSKDIMSNLSYINTSNDDMELDRKHNENHISNASDVNMHNFV